MSKEELISKACGFISYLFREPQIKINRIFLFGSVARGDFDSESDIDLFIDVDAKNEKEILKKANHALRRFNEIEGKKWDLKGMGNEISLKVGNLNEWGLKSSVAGEGIVLYSLAGSSSLKKMLLFNLEPVTPVKKRIKIIRKLFGRKEAGYKDSGLVIRYDGKILNPRSFLVSNDGLMEITSFLAKEKVNYQFYEVWK